MLGYLRHRVRCGATGFDNSHMRVDEHEYGVRKIDDDYKFNTTVASVHTDIVKGFEDFRRVWMFYHERRCCGRRYYVPIKDTTRLYIVQHCVCEPTDEDECWCQIKPVAHVTEQRWLDLHTAENAADLLKLNEKYGPDA